MTRNRITWTDGNSVTIDDPDDEKFRRGRWVELDVADIFGLNPRPEHEPHRWPITKADADCLLKKGCPK